MEPLQILCAPKYGYCSKPLKMDYLFLYTLYCNSSALAMELQ